LEFVMFSSVFAMAMAMAMQPADTTRAPREAYTRCLRAFVERSLNDRMTAEAFRTAFPQACPQQEAAYRNAVIQREVASRMSRADAQESANLEIEDAQVNFRDTFENSAPASSSASASASAAPATASAAPATPAAQPAAATTTPQ
jgi:hypothetical protein